MKNRVKAILLFLLAMFALSSSFVSAEFNYTADVQKIVLENGVTLLIKENPAYDIIAISLLSGVGSVHDPKGLEGLTYLTQRNLISGTTNRTAQEIVLELESLGVQLQAAASYDYSAVLLQTMPATFRQGFAILMDMLENSIFPEVEFERERILSQAVLQSLSDDPMNALSLLYLETFYAEHPYRYSPYGSEHGLATIEQGDLVNWHRYIYQPANLVVSVVGNFVADNILPLLEEGFGGLTNLYAGTPNPREEIEFQYPNENREIVINLPTEAAFMIIGYPAPNSFDQDSAAISVINSVLGEGMSSRLFTEIRDKQGLAYMAMSQYADRLGPSTFLTLLATHPQNIEQTREQVLYEVQRFATEGLTEAEIAQVSAQKRGSYLLENETNISQALILSMAESTGRGYHWVDEYMSFFDNVTPDDIKRVAEKYFENYTGVVITP